MKYTLYFPIVLLIFFTTPQSFASIPNNRDLASIAFNKTLTVKTRWRALMALAVTQEEKSLVHLERAVKSRDWFMRDAGIMAMNQVAPTRALIWARRMIHDPALVVRTTVVQVFRQRGQIADVDLLWGELDNKINFKRGESLWVRHHIVTALATLSSPADAPKFLRLLDDSDQRVRKAAVGALESLTGNEPSYKDSSLTQKIAHWKNYNTSLL